MPLFDTQPDLHTLLKGQESIGPLHLRGGGRVQTTGEKAFFLDSVSHNSLTDRVCNIFSLQDLVGWDSVM